MGSLLHNFSVMNHKNQVCIDDRTQTMGDNETSLAMHQLLSGGLNPLLSQGVHIGCGLIKDDHGFIRQHGSGNRDQLSLAFGEIDPIIGNQGIIPLLCPFNCFILLGSRKVIQKTSNLRFYIETFPFLQHKVFISTWKRFCYYDTKFPFLRCKVFISI